MKKINSILIANRGEPVRRAARTCRRLGIEIITIATQADLKSDWVSEGHRCLKISSYLAGGEIIEKAKAIDVDAIWPGWGFLSENHEFAKSVMENDLVWIGPPPEVILNMASKDEATVMAKKAGLVTIPEIVLPPEEPFGKKLKEISQKIGYPILLKPALGGGGQGQVVVFQEDDFESAWKEVVHINKNQFKNGPVLIQKYFTEARHIETQIVADQHGNVVVFGERECSVQRRNQKVIEESPSPALTEGQRERLFALSADFAKTIGYQNVGTIEFLFSDSKFYFLEMNTRLQVEHSVSEESLRVNGKKIDLVEQMIRIAEGDRLSFSQKDLSCEAHAIEARLYAEDPNEKFRPAPGTAQFYRFPETENLRVETAFTRFPFEVSPLYDPMIAKVIVSGKNRDDARRNLCRILKQTAILGLPTNIDLCCNILEHPDFKHGNYSTKLISQYPELTQTRSQEIGLTLATAAALRYISDFKNLRASLISQTLPTSFDHIINQIPENALEYEASFLQKTIKIKVREVAPQKFKIQMGGWQASLEIVEKAENKFLCLFPNNRLWDVTAFSDGNDLILENSLFTTRVTLRKEGENGKNRDPHAAPLVGQIVSLSVKEGDPVSKNQELFQIESMKMITTVRAKEEGIVKAIKKSIGEAVKAGDVVVEIPIAVKSQETKTALWQKEDFGEETGFFFANAFEKIYYGFLGYDADWEGAFLQLKTQIQEKHFSKKDLAEGLSRILTNALIFQSLFQKNTNALTFVAEQDTVATDHLPHDQAHLLKNIFSLYGLHSIEELSQAPRVLIHLLQTWAHHRGTRSRRLAELIQFCFQKNCTHENLASALQRWLKTNPKLEDHLKNDIWAYLYLLDPQKYYDVVSLPVALDYYNEFLETRKNPTKGLEKTEYENLLKQICTDFTTHQTSEQCLLENHYEKLEFSEFPGRLQTHLKKWFASFLGRRLTLPQVFRDHVVLYELVAKAKEVRDAPPRFVAFALFAKPEIEITPQGEVKIQTMERAAIDAYKVLRLIQIGETHQPNSVFLMCADDQALPWKTRDLVGQEKALTPQNAGKIAARVGGFASSLQIESTEVVFPILNDEDKKTYWVVTEYRHSTSKEVISRPPILIDEKLEIPVQDRMAQLNDRQQRMGKLLNPDRAMLLFDKGEYKELFFPEVDDDAEIGLNVYQGKVNGILTLAYAGDFRFRGGALGEREGKKLASTVVLAYLTGQPLVAFHDGAGANIKESIASLGWAGAYFGAIAHTGGFSNREKFRRWYKGHICRDYFDQVVSKFINDLNVGARHAVPLQIDAIIDNVPRQLLHFHLHVGATVGMLVYGASIAHASLMNDQPESYRVLTGATTVKKVLGENATNYSLGGAKAHFERSGDIEMVFQTEEQVIDHTRKLLDLFTKPERLNQIQRDPQKPILETPKRAGILLGRAALESHIDDGKFFEIRSGLKGAEGLLTGYASLAGQPVAIVATATDYGLANANSFKKATLLLEAAQDLSLPVILATGAQWEAPRQPASTKWLNARAEFFNALTRCEMPVVSLALGPRALEQSIHAQTDLTVYAKRGDESVDENERALKLCPLAALNLKEAFDKIALAFKYLPSQKTSLPASDLFSKDPIDRESKIRLPEDLSQAYEMREVIRAVFDWTSFLELWPDDKLPLITGLATLGGCIVGVIADNPEIESGAQNVDSIEKFTRLNRLCERFSLPIVEINDSPAFRPGEEQEHAGIQGVGGRSIREECLSDIPKIAVTLRQNYGGRLIHANLITLGSHRKGLILENAKVGVMGAKGAVGVLYAKKLIALPEKERAEAQTQWQKEYEIEQLDPQKAVDLGYMEGPIKSEHIRKKLFEQLQFLLSIR